MRVFLCCELSVIYNYYFPVFSFFDFSRLNRIHGRVLEAEPFYEDYLLCIMKIKNLKFKI